MEKEEESKNDERERERGLRRVCREERSLTEQNAADNMRLCEIFGGESLALCSITEKRKEEKTKVDKREERKRERRRKGNADVIFLKTLHFIQSSATPLFIEKSLLVDGLRKPQRHNRERVCVIRWVGEGERK